MPSLLIPYSYFTTILYGFGSWQYPQSTLRSGIYAESVKNWSERILRLVNNYNVYEVGNLIDVAISQDFSTMNWYFHFVYTDKAQKTRIIFTFGLSDYWIAFNDLGIGTGHRNKEVEKLLSDEKTPSSDLHREYLGLFYNKVESYLKEYHREVYHKQFKTKLIRATADHLNRKTQLYLNKRLLENIKFEELL